MTGRAVFAAALLAAGWATYHGVYRTVGWALRSLCGGRPEVTP